MLKKILCSALFVAAQASAQTYVGSAPSKIVSITSHNKYGGGDVIFSLEHSSAECQSGYWLTSTDAGFKADLSLLLAAYQAKNTVVIYGIPTEIWPGSSSGKFCKLYSVTLK